MRTGITAMTTITDGRKIIHVNKQHIAMNAKDNGNRQVYTIKHHNKTTYAHEVYIDGPCRLVYNGKQLSCGARAWIETDAALELIGAATFKEVRNEN